MNHRAADPPLPGHLPAVVVGGGQAGLSVSYHLKEQGIEHLVFEKHRLGHAWRAERWDTFCLVTPNWQCKLPGFDYPGSDPQGFMQKDDIVRYIESFAASFGPPLREGVEVVRLRRSDSGSCFEVQTTAGDCTADQVVVAVGGYHQPMIPRSAERLPEDVVQVHSSQYRNPQALPEGGVLVVGSGQSGCQIAEDLHLAGRRVHLCVGGAPRTARRYRGKDVVQWLHEMGYYDIPVHEHPLKERVRAKANHYVTGRDGGREIDLRRLALEGMRLYGRLQDIRGSRLYFALDLRHNLDNADAVAESIKTTIDKHIAKNRIDVPVEERYRPVWAPDHEPTELDYREAGIRSVVWSIGYRTDFRWIELPVFDGKGYPGHQRGVTQVEGLYFLGLPWLYTWGSGRFSGIARDAAHVAEHIGSRCRASHTNGATALNELAIGS
jgi:putative flavoprotein involved in K+ transport